MATPTATLEERRAKIEQAVAENKPVTCIYCNAKPARSVYSECCDNCISIQNSQFDAEVAAKRAAEAAKPKTNGHAPRVCQHCGVVEVSFNSRYCSKCNKDPKRKRKVNPYATRNADGSANLVRAPQEPVPAEDVNKFMLAENEDGAWKGQTMDTMTLKDQKFIWDEKIPLGEIVLLSGKGDCGKGTCLCDFAARISTGRDWPDGAKNEMGPRKVLLCSTEDDPNKVVLPRLIAAGADLKNIIWLTATHIETKEGQKLTKKQFVQLKGNLSLLRQALKNDPDVVAVMLDPISDFWGATNPNDNKEMGALLNEIRVIIEARDASLIGIIHHNKRDNLDAAQSIVGAGRTGNAPRAVLGFMVDPNSPKDAREYYMNVDKGNDSATKIGMKYKIVSEKVKGRERSIGKIEWLGKHDKTTDELKQEARERAKNPVDSNAVKATAFLKKQLEGAPNVCALSATLEWRMRRCQHNDN